ncbi:3-dehydroquinate dehydratase-1 [Methanomicrobium sp. W14]|uniref:type I 3-dehydroquinate dehydratase n=1 Tax=Methanomicrobium sp. W14 TaxID=2817839 RepID=UPI001AEB2717|nr:type I 3-dehydroquinate dehydratase [Methanomicrobium sp. W14]MBP2132304.1 3-dehydroquinate dehydratase-1 [Methanomicrobium sp. W14]
MKDMKTALSLSSPDRWDDALLYGADFREIRLDLVSDSAAEKRILELCTDKKDEIPCIITIRSKKEGGNFSEDSKTWRRSIEPWVSCADYIDIERDFSEYAPEIKKSGVRIISSVHLKYMPGPKELKEIETRLREYGDIPKIVVTPKNCDDVSSFIDFTIKSQKPLITSIMGKKYKAVRIPLIILGSMLIYCHSGSEASEGQYHIKDIKKLKEILLK